jgi:uncharacterized protein YjdB
MIPLVALLSACTAMTVTSGDSTQVASTCSFVGVALQPVVAKIFVGDTLRLSLTLPPAGCGWNRVGSDSPQIGFSSSDTTIATVDSSGTVRGRAPGRATIIAAPYVDPTDIGAMLVDVSARP